MEVPVRFSLTQGISKSFHDIIKSAILDLPSLNVTLSSRSHKIIQINGKFIQNYYG